MLFPCRQESAALPVVRFHEEYRAKRISSAIGGFISVEFGVVGVVFLLVPRIWRKIFRLLFFDLFGCFIDLKIRG
jgi:predicted PurR-regulated permease PerM